jgi:hypothetical protein
MKVKLLIVFGVLTLLAAAVPPALDYLPPSLLGMGHNAGLKVTSEESQTDSTITFTIDNEKDNYLLYVLLDGVDPATDKCTAEVNGQSLQCAAIAGDDYRGWIVVSLPPADKQKTPKFEWSSGNRLSVHVPKVLSGPKSVKAWELYPDGSASDSSTFARHRSVRNTICLVLVIVGIIGGIGSLFIENKEPPLKALNAQECLSRLIEQVSVDGEKQSAKVRRALELIVNQGVDTILAMRTAGLKLNANDINDVERAKQVLKEMFKNLSKDLADKATHLPTDRSTAHGKTNG